MNTCLKNSESSVWTLCGELVDTLDAKGRDSEVVVSGAVYPRDYCAGCRRAHEALSELEAEEAASTATGAAPSFAEQVFAAARGLRRDAGAKVFISRVWEAMGRPELKAFQASMLEANRTRALTLTRCDLVSAFQQSSIAASEITSYGATFHFLVVE